MWYVICQCSWPTAGPGAGRETRKNGTASGTIWIYMGETRVEAARAEVWRVGNEELLNTANQVNSGKINGCLKGRLNCL